MRQYSSGRMPSVSGTWAATSQLSLVVFPVLTPPNTSKPFAGRAFTVKSAPFQCSICSP